MAGLCAPLPTFAVALTGDRARLVVDVDRYSFIVSDLHRLLVAGLRAHCETFWTLLSPAAFERVWRNQLIVGEHLPPYVTPPHDGFPRWASNICARSIRLAGIHTHPDITLRGQY